MTRSSRSVGFAVADDDMERLDRLVQRFGRGNRSEFLRVAMDRMEAAERAERLRRLQTYGARKAAERGVTLDAVDAIVDRALRRR